MVETAHDGLTFFGSSFAWSSIAFRLPQTSVRKSRDGAHGNAGDRSASCYPNSPRGTPLDARRGGINPDEAGDGKAKGHVELEEGENAAQGGE